jgi:hypothetical protein
MKQTVCIFIFIFLVLTTLGCSGGGLTTREKGAGVGALGGTGWQMLTEFKSQTSNVNGENKR